MYATARQRCQGGRRVPEFECFLETGQLVLRRGRLPPARAPAPRPRGGPSEAPVLMEALPPRSAEGRRSRAGGPVRIEIFSERNCFLRPMHCPAILWWMEPAEWLGSPLPSVYPLHLVSNQPRHRLHSSSTRREVSQAPRSPAREHGAHQSRGRLDRGGMAVAMGALIQDEAPALPAR